MRASPGIDGKADVGERQRDKEGQLQTSRCESEAEGHWLLKSGVARAQGGGLKLLAPLYRGFIPDIIGNMRGRGRRYENIPTLQGIFLTNCMA